MKRHTFVSGIGAPVLAIMLMAAVGCEPPGERTTWGPTQTDERARLGTQDRDELLQEEQMGRMGDEPRTQDLEVQRRVREALSQEEDLSTMARNVQVEVSDGVVTLRGTVENEKERDEVEQIARRHAPFAVSTEELQIEGTPDAGN
jgi:DNA-binding transcriptional regulator YbjK